MTAKQLDTLLSKVSTAGAKVSAGAKKADKALAGVRDAIGKHEKAIAKLKATVADAAKMKIVAKLCAEKSSSMERAVDAKIIFKRNTADAQKVYGDIVRGDLDAIVHLLDRPSNDVEVIESATTLSERATMKRKRGYTAVLVGFELGALSMFEVDSEVTIRGGRVAVVTEAKLRSERAKPHEEREVSFVDAYELSAAEATREFDVALEISHEDQKLRRREIERIIRGFESAKLLPDGTLQRALDQFDSWIGPGEKNRLQADIKFALRLDGKQLERILCLDRRDGTALRPDAQREMFCKVVKELTESGFNDEEDVSRMAEAIHLALGSTGPMPAAEEVLFAYTPKLQGQIENMFSDQHKRARLRRAGALRALCMTLVEAIDTMGDIYTAVPKIGAGEGWDAVDYNKAQEALKEKLRSWLKAGWRDAVRPKTIAFVGTLIALAKQDGEADSGFLSLTMTRRSGEPETVVLT